MPNMFDTGVNAMMGDAGNGCYGVALIRWNSAFNQWSLHGRYPTKDHAWRVAEIMVGILQHRVAAYGDFTDDERHDAFRSAHLQAESEGFRDHCATMPQTIMPRNYRA